MKLLRFILWLFTAVALHAASQVNGVNTTTADKIMGVTGNASFTGMTLDAAGGGTPTITNAWKNTSGSGVSWSNSVTGATAGRALVVAIFGVGSSGITVAVSDNIDGTTGWAQAVPSSSGSGVNVEIWYKFNIPSGVTTVTTALGANGLGGTVIIHEVSNITAFTSGEKNSGSGVSTAPATGNATNATAASIYFAAMGNVSEDNPATATLNASGTTGTWNHYSANSSNLDGSVAVVLSVPNIVVASGAARGHTWTTGNYDWWTCVAIFH